MLAGYGVRPGLEVFAIFRSAFRLEFTGGLGVQARFP
jgi:hypothetical protein